MRLDASAFHNSNSRKCLEIDTQKMIIEKSGSASDFGCLCNSNGFFSFHLNCSCFEQGFESSLQRAITTEAEAVLLHSRKIKSSVATLQISAILIRDV